MPRTELLRRRIQILLIGFIVGLVVSGVTAFPLPQEVRMLCDWTGSHANVALSSDGSGEPWLIRVRTALDATEARYPFLFYGYDWLAFAHLVIAALFVGPLRDPVKNVWVIQWGMFACAAIIPLALICGHIRGIPIYWELIDCSFGVVGIIPLAICYRWIREIEFTNPSN